MALTEQQMLWIEEGVRLAVAAVLAAVQAAGETGEMNWDAIRITRTPERALEEARRRKSGAEREAAGGRDAARQTNAGSSLVTRHSSLPEGKRNE